MPTVEMLYNLFQYDPATGKLYWLSKPHLPRKAGTEAGNLNPNGYRYVKIEGKSIVVHRVLWAMHYGVWPILDLDHKDQDTTNNRISNLREATKSQNLMNAKIHSNNTSGYRGVHWHRRSQKWVARTSVMGKQIHLGYFHDLAEAIAARDAAALKLHPDFARTA